MENSYTGKKVTIPTAAVLFMVLALLAGIRNPARAADRPKAGAHGSTVRRIVEEGFASPFYEDRSRASKRLETLGRSAGPALIPYLQDERYQVRLWTIITLGRLKYAPALDFILAFLRSRPSLDIETSLALARSLAAVGAGRIGKIEKALAGLEGSWRRVAARALKFMVTHKVIEELARFILTEENTGSYQGQFKTLRPFGEAAVYVLLDLLDLEEGELPDEYLSDKVRREVITENWIATLRWLAALALGELASPAALPRLKLLYGKFSQEFDTNLPMVRACAYACWKLGHSGPVERLLNDLLTMLAREKRSRSPGVLVSRYFDLGYTYNMIDRRREAIYWYRRCVILDKSTVTGTNNEGITAQYNIACVYSVDGRIHEGIRALFRAVDMGYAEDDWIDMDGDLDNLRADPRFSLVLARIEIKTALSMAPGVSRDNHISHAMDHVITAVDEGLRPAHWIARDPRFSLLREHEEFLSTHLRMMGRTLRSAFDCLRRLP